jgi:NarL family two-component system response regulator LiaR
MFSVFLVDDHVMVRRGLESRLSAAGRFRIIGEAASLSQGQSQLAGLESPPDLIILDLELGDENGLDLIATLKKQYAPSGKMPAILVYSVVEDPFRIQSALHMGARGYVSKSAGEAELFAAVDAVLEGRIWLDPNLELKAKTVPDIYSLFTQREREILMLVQKRCDNAAIAKKLSISVRTVENYLSRIYAKTGTAVRSDLLAL